MTIKNLHFHYGKTPILKNINLSFEEGKIYGLIGANGAGKTTLLSILSGIFKKYKGEIKGINKAGLLIQGTTLYEEATGVENLQLFCKERKIDFSQIDYVLGLVGIDEENRNKKVKNCSQGFKQRLSIARSFLTDSNLVVLDEPFTAVDLPTIHILKKAIKNYVSQNNKTIIISSHQLREIEELINIGIIIDNGEIKNIFDFDERNSNKESSTLFITTLETEKWISIFENTDLQLENFSEGLKINFTENYPSWKIIQIASQNNLHWIRIETREPLETIFHNQLSKLAE